MKRLLPLALAVVVLTPAVAFAGAATDAALGLGAFAVFNQIISGTGVFGAVVPAPAVVVRPAPIYVAPPPAVYVAPPVYFSPPVYVAPRAVYVPGYVVVRPRGHVPHVPHAVQHGYYGYRH